MKRIALIALILALTISQRSHSIAKNRRLSPTKEQIDLYNFVEPFNGNKVYLVSDIGILLARCRDCGPGVVPDSAGIHQNLGSIYARWTVVKVNDKVAFKADNGKYLSRCNSCWKSKISPIDSVFVHVDDPNHPSAQWKPVQMPNNKWAFQADNGNYLSRCQGCVDLAYIYNFAFLHIKDPDGDYSQWQVIKV